ncbi:MAG: DUF4079 domain-containing protein [Leptolyngbyaceae bacterium]|nr:DUF4079 domain-containing protein [Leptolyngbyaceae bacterium]
MDFKEFMRLIHPTLAVAGVFPLIGVVVYFAWQTRQRRLQIGQNTKSKIAPIVGPEHLKLGRWLTTAVVTVALLGLGYAIAANITTQTWSLERGRIVFAGLMAILTPTAYGCLYRARKKIWRGIFATLTGMGLIILGCQPEVYRRGYEWYLSHYYIGITAALLMIFSMAIVPDIYQDKQQRWRKVHGILNAIALLLFLLQGFTGSRDLFEVGAYYGSLGCISCFF